MLYKICYETKNLPKILRFKTVRQSRGLFHVIIANSKFHEDGSTSVRPFVSLYNAALYWEDETFEGTGKSGRIRVMG